jgi:hypothetical protein
MDYNLLRIHQSYYHRVGAASQLYVSGGYFLDARPGGFSFIRKLIVHNQTLYNRMPFTTRTP